LFSFLNHAARFISEAAESFSSREFFLQPMTNETQELTWYLGYGSNMNRGIFENRRGMRPIRAEAALLEHYCLRFNLAVGSGERGVANLELQVRARTWGVLYLITTKQSELLDRTEGVPRGAYRRIPVSVTINSGEQIAAFTYQSDKIKPGRKPSPRYIGLLIDGAQEHGLPGDYLDYLRSFELAADERLMAQDPP
jgi:cation transport regulator ChaC